MPLSPEAVAERVNYIGASDVPVILGLSPWRTPYDLWSIKTGRLANEFAPSPAAKIGLAL